MDGLVKSELKLANEDKDYFDTNGLWITDPIWGEVILLHYATKGYRYYTESKTGTVQRYDRGEYWDEPCTYSFRFFKRKKDIEKFCKSRHKNISKIRENLITVDDIKKQNNLTDEEKSILLQYYLALSNMKDFKIPEGWI